MPYEAASLDAALAGQANAAARVTFFTADDYAAEITTAGRPATTWAAPTDHPDGGRQRIGSQVTAPIPAGTTVTHWGLSSAATGGTHHGRWPLAAPETFGSAGEIQHTPTLVQSNLA